MGVAIVTGCSTGIGYATAVRLARDGHDVVATMRDPSACDLALVAAAEGLTIDVRPLDVTVDGMVESLVAAVVAERGPVDVLVNNAGVAGSGGVVEETPLAAFQEIMDTNYVGSLRCTLAVLSSMRERGTGCIVNVSSQAGRLAIPGMAPYCASKWAIEAATEALAVEVAGFGVRVVLVEPGAIMTPIWTKADVSTPTGPYAPIRNRLATVIITDVAQASPPEAVADCIAEAVATDQPRLRWLVGQGAERNVTLRARWTDERYAELWNDPDEATFMGQMFAEP